MGGVHTDLDGATTLEGLYAAGEVACVSINGANRLGSNSLTELLVFGARAGRAAAAYAEGRPEPSAALMAQAVDEERRLRGDFLDRSGGTERVASLRTEMQDAMEAGAGIYRSGEGLQTSSDKVRELKARFGRISLDDASLTFNTELVSALELANLLDVAEVMLDSAMARQESRGAHQRTDHPDRNDDRFLAHTMAYRAADGTSRIEFQPVTITRWPPGERVYGR